MRQVKNQGIFRTAFLFLIFIASCTTDPIIPPGGLPAVPAIPPVQDPGLASLCAEDLISFRHQILPILVSSCAYSGCHDAITAEHGVVLDSYETVIQEVKRGNSRDSELYKSITDSDEIMPPRPALPLTSAQITLIRDWINQGANNTDCGAPCDSTKTSFSADIFPLLQDYCVGCHNSVRSDGAVNLESHRKIIPYVDNGALLGVIRNDEFFPVMPPTGSMLSECRIAQVRKWIEEGAKDN